MGTSSFSTFSLMLGIYLSVWLARDPNYPSGYAVACHCGFVLHFLDNKDTEHLSIYLFLRNVYSCPLLILNLGYLIFCCRLIRVLYILRILDISPLPLL